METQHLRWFSYCLHRGVGFIYLKLLVASITHRVYVKFYKICIIETKKKANPCHKGKAYSLQTGNSGVGGKIYLNMHSYKKISLITGC